MVIFLLFPFLFFFLHFSFPSAFFSVVVWNGPPFFFVGIFVEKLTEVKIGFLVFVCVCVLSSFKMAAVSESIGPLRKPRGCFAPKSSGQFLAFLFLRNYPINFYFSRVAFSNCWAFKEEEEEEENADFFPVYTCGKNTGRWKTENH